MLSLITKPVGFGISIATGTVKLVASRLGGSSSPPQVPPGAGQRRATVASTAVEETPEPAHRDPSASDWDEDALVAPGGSAPDDLILLDRVKTEIFRPADAEKGQVNVNVENGVVYLRGDLDDPDQIEYFEVAAAEVDGVVRVENLIGSSA